MQMIFYQIYSLAYIMTYGYMAMSLEVLNEVIRSRPRPMTGVSKSCLYIGWLYRNFFISYLCPLWCEASSEKCLLLWHHFLSKTVLLYEYGHVLKPTDSILFQ